ncbi:MAG: Fic family protein [bacterium]|nr:Fic family protein [bacterium]
MTQANKLGISDEEQLAKQEEQRAKKKAVELLEKGTLNKLKAGTADTLTKIHKILFEEIYDYAGKFRTANVDSFTPADKIKAELELVNKMPQKTIDEIIAKFVKVYVIHPFTTGNGRALRVWLDVITRKELNQTIDWSQIDKDAYAYAIDLCTVNPIDITSLIKNALNSDTEDREVYTKSIDANFAISGYHTYRTRYLG